MRNESRAVSLVLVLCVGIAVGAAAAFWYVQRYGAVRQPGEGRQRVGARV